MTRRLAVLFVCAVVVGLLVPVGLSVTASSEQAGSAMLATQAPAALASSQTPDVDPYLQAAPVAEPKPHEVVLARCKVFKTCTLADGSKCGVTSKNRPCFCVLENGNVVCDIK